jgi:hypothetical protein
MKKSQYSLVFVLIIFIGIIIIYNYKTNLEGLQNPLDFSFTNKFASFCNIYGSSANKLNSKCNEFTKTNCNSTSCCVWSNSKCVAGNIDGPIYNTDQNGKTIEQDYYFQNKCYGKQC